MALTDEVFQKHLDSAKKHLKKRYNHFRPFDDPDHQKVNSNIEASKAVNNKKETNVTEGQQAFNNFHIASLNYDEVSQNKTQTRHKQDTNSTQSSRKPDTIQTQKPLNLNTNKTQTRHKQDTQSDTNINTNSPLLSNNKLNINVLVGSQRKLMFYMYGLCKMQGNKVTPPLTIESIHENAEVEKGSIKTSLARLIKKHFLIKEEIKTGRAGWVIFRIPDPVYQALFNNEISLAITQNRHKQDTESNTKTNSTSYVSSSINIKSTTTIPEDLKNIDYSCLQELGFEESHIIQIHREYIKNPEISLSAEIIQASINALAFDLKHNNLANDLKSHPVVFLTCLLKKGQPYSSKTPEKVLTPREEAMKEYMLAQEQKNAKMLEIERKTKELALQEWLDLLSEEELLDFNQEPRLEGIPDKIYQTSRRKKAKEFAKDYFSTVIWPKKRKEIFDEAK